MKAVAIESYGGSENLKMIECPRPEPEADEVLIEVAYAGVNPVDWKLREGYLQSVIPHEFPIILGWDVSGTVVGKGKNVKEFEIGDEVYGYIRKPLLKWGAYAEFVTAQAKNIAKKPRNLSMAEAAGLPLISLTAWQSLFDAAHLKKGESILIHGGSGGVGSMAVQFAKHQGATVYATASFQKHAYVKELGADLAIDYKLDFVEAMQKAAPGGVDVVFDCVGKETFRKSFPCLKIPGGRIVSILEHLDPDEAQKIGIQASYVFVAPNGPQLEEIAQLVEANKVVPPKIVQMPLAEAAQAQDKLRAGEVFGKLVLKVK